MPGVKSITARQRWHTSIKSAGFALSCWSLSISASRKISESISTGMRWALPGGSNGCHSESESHKGSKGELEGESNVEGKYGSWSGSMIWHGRGNLGGLGVEPKSSATGMYTQYKEAAFERAQSASNVHGLSNDKIVNSWVGASALAVLPATEIGVYLFNRFLRAKLRACEICPTHVSYLWATILFG